MRLRNPICIILLILLARLVLPIAVLAAVGDYLVLENIGPYKLYTGIPGRVFSGPPIKYSETSSGGILSTTEHFQEGDISYEAAYTESSSKWPYVKVEVTRHAGSDSDKWLAHELDIEFRNYYGIPGHYVKKINGNIVYVFGAAGRTYRWLSGNKVVEIEYHDTMLTKPEPIEVVQAYLAKHPSTLPDTIISKGDNIAVWIKDEMDRRLWLCDKWLSQLALGKMEVKPVLDKVKESLEIFLDYREKYFGINAEGDEDALSSYLKQNDERSIRNKLAAYKSWWAANKSKSIRVP